MNWSKEIERRTGTKAKTSGLAHGPHDTQNNGQTSDPHAGHKMCGSPKLQPTVKSITYLAAVPLRDLVGTATFFLRYQATDSSTSKCATKMTPKFLYKH